MRLKPDYWSDGFDSGLFVTDTMACDGSTTQEDGSFEGFAMLYNKTNANLRRYEHGCFARSLRDNIRVMMLWNHTADNVIGKWNEFYDSGNQMRDKGKFILNTSGGKDTYELAKADAIGGQSVGWMPYYKKSGEIHGVEETKDGVIVVKEANLVEVSIVSFPAVENKRMITKVYAAEDIETVRELEQYIRDQYRLPRQEAKALISHCMRVRDRRAGRSSDSDTAGCHGDGKKSAPDILKGALQEIMQ